MYNEEQKQRYIKNYCGEYKEGTIKNLKRIFENAAPLEELLGKDLFDFSGSEIVKFYKLLGSTSADSLYSVNQILMNYTAFAITEDMVADRFNHYEEISREIILTCVNKRRLDSSILSRKEIEQMVNSLENPVDQYAVMAPFEGIVGDEGQNIFQLKIEDIDIQAKVAHLFDGRTIPVSERFIKICEEASKQEIYISKNGNKNILCESPYIYRRRKMKNNSIGTHNSLSTLLRKIGIDNGIVINMHLLYVSGTIQMVNDICEEYDITANEVFYNSKYFNILTEKYVFNMYVRKNFLEKYKDFLIN